MTPEAIPSEEIAFFLRVLNSFIKYYFQPATERIAGSCSLTYNVIKYKSSVENTTHSSHVSITHGKTYEPNNSLYFLVKKSVNSIIKCDTQSASYSTHRTVSFIPSDLNICSLYKENNSSRSMRNYTKAFVLRFDVTGENSSNFNLFFKF